MDSWEFGRTVRRWRDRVAPTAVGLPVGGRRRAAGLRREELAALAGISVNYLTRLEQGQSTSPSAQVVEALTRALRVTLAPEFRAAVVLCDVEGMSYEEIADILDAKLGTVRSRIHRGRAMLREALAHRAPGSGRQRFRGPKIAWGGAS